jgi:hypothetical protein
MKPYVSTTTILLLWAEGDSGSRELGQPSSGLPSTTPPQHKETKESSMEHVSVRVPETCSHLCTKSKEKKNLNTIFNQDRRGFEDYQHGA